MPGGARAATQWNGWLQSVAQVWRGAGEAVARVRLPDGTDADPGVRSIRRRWTRVPGNPPSVATEVDAGVDDAFVLSVSGRTP